MSALLAVLLFLLLIDDFLEFSEELTIDLVDFFFFSLPSLTGLSFFLFFFFSKIDEGSIETSSVSSVCIVAAVAPLNFLTNGFGFRIDDAWLSSTDSRDRLLLLLLLLL